MADNVYKIIIEYGGSGEGNGGGNEQPPRPPQAPNPEIPTIGKGMDADLKKSAVKVLATLHTAVNIGKQIQSTAIHYVQVTTAHDEQARRQEWAMNFGSQILDDTASIGMGAYIGGVAGAAVVGAKIAVQKTISFAQRMAMIDAQRTVENNQIRLMNIRAGTNQNRYNGIE